MYIIYVVYYIISYICVYIYINCLCLWRSQIIDRVITYYKWLQMHKGLWIFKLKIVTRNQQLKAFLMATPAYAHTDVKWTCFRGPWLRVFKEKFNSEARIWKECSWMGKKNAHLSKASVNTAFSYANEDFSSREGIVF